MNKSIPNICKSTLLDLIDNIGSLLSDEADSEEFDSKFNSVFEAKIYSGEIARRLKITNDEALIFAVTFFRCAEDTQASTKEIAAMSRFPFRNLDKLTTALNSLYEKGYLFRETGLKARFNYAVIPEVYKAILANEIPKIQNYKTDIYGLIDKIKIYLYRIDEDLELDQAYTFINRIYSFNKGLPVVKLINELKLNMDETMILSSIFVLSSQNEEEFLLHSLVMSIFKTTRDFIRVKRLFQNSLSKLVKNGIVVFNEDAFILREKLTLTKKGKELIFGKDKETFFGTQKEKSEGLILPNSIAVKKMFYNEDEEAQLFRISKIINQGQCELIREKLKSKGMPEGTTILFYGEPGTGKTESVLQIAKETGRAIFQVDISSIKDKFVGESEKQARELFLKYKKFCASLEVTPILFMNEADGILSKRLTVGSAVEQTFNSIQNIFLEELENFSGILFATTNLTGNLDSAFDRRFLFKVKFELPSVEMRSKIIRERIPFLTEDESMKLANEHKLSGGQLENIAKKIITEEILTGRVPDYKLIYSFCNEESVVAGNNKYQTELGFRLQKKES